MGRRRRAELEYMAGKLREARVAAGLTQPQVAAHVGVETGAVSEWENAARAPRGHRLLKLGELLDLTPLWWRDSATGDDNLGLVERIDMLHQEVEACGRNVRLLMRHLGMAPEEA